MASLTSVIQSIYENSYSYSRWNNGSNTSPVTETRFMEIPISDSTFELPILAITAFGNMLNREEQSDTLVAEMYSTGYTSTYKSLEAIMKELLARPFYYHLSKISIQNTSDVYYSTFGAVFNAEMKPIMMLSWIMERMKTEGHDMYSFMKPLLRIDPETWLLKENSVQKFLSGRMITNALESTIYPPYNYECREYFNTERYGSDTFKVKVEIEESPFIVRSIDTPSISATNEGLLQLAANHIDELMQY